jgi:hypothetical protein
MKIMCNETPNVSVVQDKTDFFVSSAINVKDRNRFDCEIEDILTKTCVSLSFHGRGFPNIFWACKILFSMAENADAVF